MKTKSLSAFKAAWILFGPQFIDPDFDPAMQAIPVWQASKHPPAGAWWEDEVQREKHSRELLAEAGRLHRKRSTDEETQ